MSFVYILTNYKRNVLYIGSMVDLIYRTKQHKEKYYPDSFTARYNINLLVYFEILKNISEARCREHQIKQYSRKNKEKLIALFNPNKIDLYDDLIRFYNNNECCEVVNKLIEERCNKN